MFDVYEIKEFKGQWNWLSNMTVIQPFIEDGISYNSVENYYQSMKTESVGRRLQISKMRPHESKSIGGALTLREDWEDIKDGVMRRALEIKFSQPVYYNLLANTGVYELVEGNYWNDKYWGFCLKTNKGQNKLGKMIMDIRTNMFEELDLQDMLIDQYKNIKRELDNYDYKHMDKATIRFFQNDYITKTKYDRASIEVIDELFGKQTFDEVVEAIKEGEMLEKLSEAEKIHVTMVYQTLIKFVNEFKNYCEKTNLTVSIM